MTRYVKVGNYAVGLCKNTIYHQKIHVHTYIEEVLRTKNSHRKIVWFFSKNQLNKKKIENLVSRSWTVLMKCYQFSWLFFASDIFGLVYTTYLLSMHCKNQQLPKLTSWKFQFLNQNSNFWKIYIATF